MNWGNKLIIVFVLFGGFILYMVYKSLHVQVDLVSKDYYKDELVYQDVIDGRNNVEALKSKASISQNNDNVVIQLPEEMSGKKTEGQVWFYSPDNAKKDAQFDLQTNSSAQQLIDKKKLHAGNYTVKISWTESNKKYYIEQALTIP